MKDASTGITTLLLLENIAPYGFAMFAVKSELQIGPSLPVGSGGSCKVR